MNKNLQSVKRTEESGNHSEGIAFCILEDREKWIPKKRRFWMQ
jgi:hypothetical protein